MWTRPKSDKKGGGSFGVGVQVVVRLDRSRYPESAIEDPVGVIVAPGEHVGSALYVPIIYSEAVWEVQFNEPFYGLNGSGPHTSAVIPQGFLEAAPEA